MEHANSIQVTEKSYKQADGSVITAHMLRLGETDYLTVADAAEAFGVTAGYIRTAISRHSLVASNWSDQNLDKLKQMGVVPMKTTVVNLLPRDTLDALVRIINTDEAKAAYKQILGEWREAKQTSDALKPVLTEFDHRITASAQAAVAAGEFTKFVASKLDATNARVTQAEAALQLVKNDTRAAVDLAAGAEAKAQAVAEIQGEAMLTTAQKKELLKRMNQRIAKLGYNASCLGKIYGGIKIVFLGVNSNDTTWQWFQLPQKYFSEIIEYIDYWNNPHRNQYGADWDYRKYLIREKKIVLT